MQRIGHSRASFQITILKKRDGAKCWICLETEAVILARGDALTRDHLIPRARGGRDNLENLKLACRRCNGLRGCRAAYKIIPGVIPGKHNSNRYRPEKEDSPYKPAKKSITKKAARKALRDALPKPSTKLLDIARGTEMLLSIAQRMVNENYRRRYYEEIGRLGD